MICFFWNLNFCVFWNTLLRAVLRGTCYDLRRWIWLMYGARMIARQCITVSGVKTELLLSVTIVVNGEEGGVGTLGSESFPTCLPLRLAFRGAWLYIVGRSDDSTSGPGPMYVFRAHICLFRFPMYMLWAGSAVFNTRARQVMFGPIIRPNL